MDFTKIYNEDLKETLFTGIHKSGLKVYVLPKKGYSKSYAIFATKYGSIDSNFIIPGSNEKVKVPDGIAHFLEHKLFEEEDGGNAFDRFSKYGSSVNAFTSFNTTGYLFSCTTNFYDNLEILLDYVQSPFFTDENVSKEQGIIGQEIRMYEDNPEWRVFFNFLSGMYVKHPVKKDIAGTIESISKINKEFLYKCYETFYHPSNMILFTVGDVEQEKVGDLVTKLIKKEVPLETEIERIYPQEPKSINKKITRQNLTVSLPLFLIGFKDKDVGYDGNELMKKEITTNILLEMIAGKSTSFYQNLYEKGLINNSFDKEYIGEQYYGFTSFGGESPDPEKVKELLIEEIKGIKLEDKKFQRTKKVIYGRFLRNFNNIESLANGFAFNLFKNINLFDYLKIYKTIKIEDVEMRLKEHFDTENIVLSIIEPVK